MSTAQPTLDDVWRLFQETDRRFQETDRKFQETERLLKEQAQHTDRKFQDTERKLQEVERLLKEQSQPTEKKTKAPKNPFTSEWDELMELLVEGDLVNLLIQRGIAIAYTSTRLKGKRPGGVNYEFDIIAHTGEEVVFVEVKTTLRPDDVKEFLDKLDHLKDWIPRYAHNRIYGAMAWLSADANAEVMVIKRGLFSIRATGDSASIQNDPDFTPQAW